MNSKRDTVVCHIDNWLLIYSWLLRCINLCLHNWGLISSCEHYIHELCLYSCRLVHLYNVNGWRWSAMKQILNWKDCDNLNFQFFLLPIKMANGITCHECPMSLTKQITIIQKNKKSKWLWRTEYSVTLGQSRLMNNTPLGFWKVSFAEFSERWHQHYNYIKILEINKWGLMVFLMNQCAEYFFSRFIVESLNLRKCNHFQSTRWIQNAFLVQLTVDIKSKRGSKSSYLSTRKYLAIFSTVESLKW